jgi:hypothetical protein
MKQGSDILAELHTGEERHNEVREEDETATFD